MGKPPSGDQPKDPKEPTPEVADRTTSGGQSTYETTEKLSADADFDRLDDRIKGTDPTKGVEGAETPEGAGLEPLSEDLTRALEGQISSINRAVLDSKVLTGDVPTALTELGIKRITGQDTQGSFRSDGSEPPAVQNFTGFSITVPDLPGARTEKIDFKYYSGNKTTFTQFADMSILLPPDIAGDTTQAELTENGGEPVRLPRDQANCEIIATPSNGNGYRAALKADGNLNVSFDEPQADGATRMTLFPTDANGPINAEGVKWSRLIPATADMPEHIASAYKNGDMRLDFSEPYNGIKTVVRSSDGTIRGIADTTHRDSDGSAIVESPDTTDSDSNGSATAETPDTKDSDSNEAPADEASDTAESGPSGPPKSEAIDTADSDRDASATAETPDTIDDDSIARPVEEIPVTAESDSSAPPNSETNDDLWSEMGVESPETSDAMPDAPGFTPFDLNSFGPPSYVDADNQPIDLEKSDSDQPVFSIRADENGRQIIEVFPNAQAARENNWVQRQEVSFSNNGDLKSKFQTITQKADDGTTTTQYVQTTLNEQTGQQVIEVFPSADAERENNWTQREELNFSEDGDLTTRSHSITQKAADGTTTTELVETTLNSNTGEASVTRNANGEQQTIKFDRNGNAVSFEITGGPDSFKYGFENGQIISVSKNGQLLEGAELEQEIRNGEVMLAGIRAEQGIEKPPPDVLDDLRPTEPREGNSADGTLIVDYGDEYHAYKVKDGRITDEQGADIGFMNDSGEMSLNGQAIRLGESVDIDMAFHGAGTDGQRLDLVSPDWSDGLTGIFTSPNPNNPESLAVIGGNMFGPNGEFVGHLAPDGSVSLLEGTHTGSTVINNRYDGWTFNGEQSGHLRFLKSGPEMVNGTLTIPDENGTRTQYDVRLGMIIDRNTQEQIGWLTAPTEGPDGQLRGGIIERLNADGTTSVESLASHEYASFDLTVVGATGNLWGSQSQKIMGVSLGDEVMANGEYRPGQGYFNVREAIALEAERIEYAEGRIADGEDASFEEHRQELARKQQEIYRDRLLNGRWNEDVVAEIKGHIDAVEAEISSPIDAQREELDSWQSTLEELPSDTSTISGTVRVPGADGATMEWTVRNGQIFDSIDGVNPIGTIDSATGAITMTDRATGQVTQTEMKALPGAVWNLNWTDAEGVQQDVSWLSTNGNIYSMSDLLNQQQAELNFAYELYGGANTGASAEARARGDEYWRSIRRIFDETGITSDADLQMVTRGPAEFVREHLEGEEPRSEPIRIDIPTIDDPTQVNGMLRIGQEVYSIRDGELYQMQPQEVDGQTTMVADEKPSGRLHENYMVELPGRGMVSLAEQNRVLMQFTIGNDENVNQIMGFGKPKVTPNGYEAGGLVDVRQLEVRAREAYREALKGEKQYWDNLPYATAALGDSLTGAESSMAMTLKLMADDVDNMVEAIDETFSTGFDLTSMTSDDVDEAIGDAQSVINGLGISGTNFNDLAQKASQAQATLNNGVIMGVMTVATAGVGTIFAGLGGAAKLGYMARFGMVAAEVATTGVVGGAISAVGRQSISGDNWDNFTSGAIEGSLMGFGGVLGRATSEIKMGSLLKTFAQNGGRLSRSDAAMLALKSGYYVGDSVFQTAGMGIAAQIREGRPITDALDSELMMTGTLINLFGRATEGLRVGSSEAFRDIVGEGVSGFSSSVVDGMNQAIAQQDLETARRLGISIDNASPELLARYRDYDAAFEQGVQTGLVAALTSTVTSSASSAATHVIKTRVLPSGGGAPPEGLDPASGGDNDQGRELDASGTGGGSGTSGNTGGDATGGDSAGADTGGDAGSAEAGVADAGVDDGGADAGGADAGTDDGGADAGADDGGADAGADDGGADAGADDGGADAGGDAGGGADTAGSDSDTAGDAGTAEDTAGDTAGDASGDGDSAESSQTDEERGNQAQPRLKTAPESDGTYSFEPPELSQAEIDAVAAAVPELSGPVAEQFAEMIAGVQETFTDDLTETVQNVEQLKLEVKEARAQLDQEIARLKQSGYTDEQIANARTDKNDPLFQLDTAWQTKVDLHATQTRHINEVAQARQQQLQVEINAFIEAQNAKTPDRPLPPITVQVDQLTHAAGSYAFGEGVVVLPKNDLVGADGGADLARTIFHELVHVQQDTEIIRNSIDATTQAGGPFDIKAVQQHYEQQTGRKLDAKWLQTVASQTQNAPPLTANQSTRAQELAQELLRNQGPVAEQSEELGNTARVIQSKLNDLASTRDSKAVNRLFKALTDPGGSVLAGRLFGENGIPADVQKMIKDWAQLPKDSSGLAKGFGAPEEVRTSLARRLTERRDSINSQHQEIIEAYKGSRLEKDAYALDSQVRRPTSGDDGSDASQPDSSTNDQRTLAQRYGDLQDTSDSFRYVKDIENNLSDPPVFADKAQEAIFSEIQRHLRLRKNGAPSLEDAGWRILQTQKESPADQSRMDYLLVNSNTGEYHILDATERPKPPGLVKVIQWNRSQFDSSTLTADGVALVHSTIDDLTRQSSPLNLHDHFPPPLTRSSNTDGEAQILAYRRALNRSGDSSLRGLASEIQGSQTYLKHKTKENTPEFKARTKAFEGDSNRQLSEAVREYLGVDPKKPRGAFADTAFDTKLGDVSIDKDTISVQRGEGRYSAKVTADTIQGVFNLEYSKAVEAAGKLPPNEMRTRMAALTKLKQEFDIDRTRTRTAARLSRRDADTVFGAAAPAQAPAKKLPPLRYSPEEVNGLSVAQRQWSEINDGLTGDIGSEYNADVKAVLELSLGDDSLQSADRDALENLLKNYSPENPDVIKQVHDYLAGEHDAAFRPRTESDNLQESLRSNQNSSSGSGSRNRNSGDDSSSDGVSLRDRVKAAPEEIRPGLKQLMKLAKENPKKASEYKELIDDVIQLEAAGEIPSEARFLLEDGEGLDQDGVELLKTLLGKDSPAPPAADTEITPVQSLSREEIAAKTEAAFEKGWEQIQNYEYKDRVADAQEYTNAILSKFFPGVEANDVKAGNEGITVILSDNTVLKFRPDGSFAEDWGTRDLDIPLLPFENGTEARPMKVSPESDAWVVYRQPFAPEPDTRAIEKFVDKIVKLRGDSGDLGRAHEAAARNIGLYTNPDTGRTEVRTFDYDSIEIEHSPDYVFTEDNVLDLGILPRTQADGDGSRIEHTRAGDTTDSDQNYLTTDAQTDQSSTSGSTVSRNARGQLVNERGAVVNEQGQIVDSKGNPIETEFPNYPAEEFQQARPRIVEDLNLWKSIEGNNVGEEFESLTDRLGFTDAEKNLIIDGLTTVREHGARMRAADPEQENNWKHTQREFGAALDYADRNGFTKQETQDLLFAAMFSDGLKTKSNFTTHNMDGATAFDHFARTHLADMPASRVDGIKQAILEHQVAPPIFMSKIYDLAISGSFKAEGRPMTEAETAAFTSLKNKISDPLSLPDSDLIDVPGAPPGAKAIKLTSDEHALLARVGVDHWYVPHDGNSWNKFSRGLIDSDGIDNYAGPGGLSKIIGLRGPEKAPWFQDRHVLFPNPNNPSEISSFDSWIESQVDFLGDPAMGKRGVATEQTRQYVADQSARMHEDIAAASARVNEWINSPEGREELGFPKEGAIEKIPGWTGTRENPDLIDYRSATPEELSRARKIWDQFSTQLAREQRVALNNTPEYAPLMRTAEESE